MDADFRIGYERLNSLSREEEIGLDYVPSNK
jgi:hypothetical protein